MRARALAVYTAGCGGEGERFFDTTRTEVRPRRADSVRRVRALRRRVSSENPIVFHKRFSRNGNRNKKKIAFRAVRARRLSDDDGKGFSRDTRARSTDAVI